MHGYTADAAQTAHTARTADAADTADATETADRSRRQRTMYVNAYILAVPASRKVDYQRIAEHFAAIAAEYGALEVVENWESEVPDGEHTDYRKAVNALPNEKIVVSWVIWPDREAGAAAHKAMLADTRMDELGEMPFDGRRMIFGGFEPIVTYRRDDALPAEDVTTR
jgi:uncharacterized protein YbaA (DUF1428 family)